MAAYQIEIDFGENWPGADRQLLVDATRRWMQIVQAALPAINIGGRVTTGLVIQANIVPGTAGGALARSGPTQYRPKTAGYLPASAILELELPDFLQLKKDGRIGDILFHETAHGMGFGMLWPYLGLIQGAGTSSPSFVGSRACAEYGLLRGTGPTAVPIQNQGGVGVADLHWRETAFGSELMSPYLPTHPNPASRVTLASMADMGYIIDLDLAEPYALPKPGTWFDGKIEFPMPRYRVVPTDPEVLPESALVESAEGLQD